MSKKKTSRVLVAGVCLATLLTPYGLEVPKVYAEMTIEDKEKQQEERVYQLLPKGDVEGIRELHQRRMSFSPYEPTGIYVNPGEEVVIQVEGTQQIKAYIGTYSYEKEEPKQFNLNPGENKISSPNGGLLYFYNYHNTGEVVAKVKKGGTPNPLFILGKHSIHFVEDWYTDNYMYATYYRTAYSKGNLESVLNLEELTNDGWGPWHEVGHQHQQNTWLWDGLGEVTVNIYSLAVQTTFGHETRLEQEGRYEAAFAYLGKPDAQEKMNVFEKLVMFWQLHLAYGDQFYPNLHQMYRLLHDTELPKSDEEKKQMFIYMTSKVAGQNLIPFFDKWGLFVNDATREKIEKLNLPKLEKEIWLSTDSNPIREKQTELYEVPYGEPNNEKVQNVVIGTKYDEKKAKELVQNLGKGVKTTGVIIQGKPEVGEKTVKVEIIDEKGNKNLIPVVVNVSYGDSLVFKGLNYIDDGDVKSIVTLQHDQKKFSAMANSNQVHSYFKEDKYFEFALLDSNGKEKNKVTVKGVENAEEFAKTINGLEFAYGDVVKVYHAESDRLNWYQNNEFIGQGKAKVEKELLFKVTEKGFERMGAQQEVTAVPQKVVIGTDAEKLNAKEFVQVKDGEVVGFVEKPNTTKIGEQKIKVETKDRFGNKKVTEVPLEVIYGDSIMFFGTSYSGSNIKSVVTLNHEEKKFSTTGAEGAAHTSFKDQKYMGMTVYDKDGKEKKEVSVKGSENTKGFAEQFNGMAFEYGDMVKVYQKEFDRFKVYKKNELVNAQYGVHEVIFKVTEQGFERVEAQQEVTAVPQKVVIGTEVEKLNAKDFVQVKDGEVVGFVEKLNTTKIGEQKVKVETKDRFGNKKVTEVPLTVTYGDSLLVYGLKYSSGDLKSVVTLHHDTKKMSATDTSNLIHDYFGDEKYFAFTLYNREGKEKKNIEIKGLESTEAFAKEVNGLAFEYGDVVKVYHAESSRLHWYQKGVYVGEGKNKEIKELVFKITENGFERSEAEQTVQANPQKVVIGTEVEKLNAKDFVQVKDGEVIGFVEKPITTKIGKQTVKVETKDRFRNKKVTEVLLEVTYGDSIVYQGLSDVVRSIVTLNHGDKKLHVTSTDEQIHSYFNNELYMGITLYDQNGTEKKHVTAEGQETSKSFAKQVNGTPFEYGDVIKVYHAEPSRLKWYKKSKLEEQLTSTEVSFKVTQSGLEQVKGTL
ncbi:wall-associated protein [Bacillus wiedmannii]|uniref:putative mucin/carbohydrate-binding domain-containing protein n=1 Tax=Bacillus wiedmannii TaxID=1890302 RepID=UPI000BEF9189|nr:putative mucin/carbohydrate-binding domain-containing protein [Bacillus wiedmannii]PEJ50042.1 wall-associated protein [Bacillus wiedmannii]